MPFGKKIRNIFTIGGRLSNLFRKKREPVNLGKAKNLDELEIQLAEHNKTIKKRDVLDDGTLRRAAISIAEKNYREELFSGNHSRVVGQKKVVDSLYLNKPVIPDAARLTPPQIRKKMNDLRNEIKSIDGVLKSMPPKRHREELVKERIKLFDLLRAYTQMGEQIAENTRRREGAKTLAHVIALDLKERPVRSVSTMSTLETELVRTRNDKVELMGRIRIAESKEEKLRMAEELKIVRGKEHELLMKVQRRRKSKLHEQAA